MPSSAFNPDSIPDLTGRVYLVTGGNTGIGKATVVGLAALLEKSFTMTRYGHTKLANILHAKQLHLKYEPAQSAAGSRRTPILVTAVHPGHIDTDLNRQATGIAPAYVRRVATRAMRCVGILDGQDKEAWSSLFAIASYDFKAADSGAYVVPYAKLGTPSAHAQDMVMAERLWGWMEKEMSKKGFLEPAQKYIFTIS